MIGQIASRGVDRGLNISCGGRQYSRVKSNWIVILRAWHDSKLAEVISVMPAIRAHSCRSRGDRDGGSHDTQGSRPPIPQKTEIVGKSICGSGETGRKSNAYGAGQGNANPVNNVVATGRWMNGEDMFMT